MKPLITAVLPCYMRPERTRRMLNCLLDQSLKNWELILIGDACPFIGDMISYSSGGFVDWKEKFYKQGNKIFYMNLAKNRGGHGAHIVNVAISIARGKYFCWLNNDDMVHREHLQFYYNSIDALNKHGQKADFVYNRSLINSAEGFDVRHPQLKFGSVGHSELVVNTNFLKAMPGHEAIYGQDWRLIENMIIHGVGKPGETPFPTYMVMSTPRYQETDID